MLFSIGCGRIEFCGKHGAREADQAGFCVEGERECGNVRITGKDFWIGGYKGVIDIVEQAGCSGSPSQAEYGLD